MYFGKGLLIYQVCPIPDTDKEGVNEEEDQCPNTPGLAKNNGCLVCWHFVEQ